MAVTKDVKWLLVGTGDIARKRVASALANAAGSSLHSICGGLERAKPIASEFGADNVYDNLDEALADPATESVYIATPVYRHCDEALKALRAGKHVLIEKPLAINTKQGNRIVEACEAKGLKAGCAYYRRCFPRYQSLRQSIDKGQLGEITLVRTTYHAWFCPAKDDPKRWRIDREKSGGGPLSDMGCHMFDLIIGLFGMPVGVFAYTGALVHSDWDVEDSSAILMKLRNGAHVVASFGWNSKTWQHDFEVVGSEARVRWLPADSGAVSTTLGRDTTEEEFPNHGNVHQPLIEDFVRSVRGGDQPICPVTEAIKTTQLLDAIYQSSLSERPIHLTDASTP